MCLLILIFFVSCNKKYIAFEDYLNNNILKNKTILENSIYPIEYLEYNARIIYSGGETYFGVYEDINNENIIFHLKYWTIVEPVEIINMNGKYLVKIKTRDNRFGWINAHYIELY
jgi:hypothetical protein